MFINIALMSIKFIAGWVMGSRALVSDAVHSFSDFFTDAIILLGARFWSEPPDINHPYGHRRIETLTSIIVGLTLTLVGFYIAWDAILALTRENTHEPPGWLAFWVALLSVITKETLYRWTVSVARQTECLALHANAWHHRSDAFSSIPVAIAIAGAHLIPSLRFLDNVGAIIVAALLIQVSYRIVRPAIDEISEIGAPRDLMHDIEVRARNVQGVLDVHAVRTRYIGSKMLVDMHILVDPALTVEQGHAIASRVCDELHSHVNNIVEVLTHIEPFGIKNTKKREHLTLDA